MTEENNLEDIAESMTPEAKEALKKIRSIPEIAIVADEDTDLDLISETMSAAIAGLMIKTGYTDLSTPAGMIASACLLKSKKTARRLITTSENYTDQHAPNLSNDDISTLRSAYQSIIQTTEDTDKPASLDMIIDKAIPILIIPGPETLIISGDSEPQNPQDIVEIDIEFNTDAKTPTALAFTRATGADQTIRLMLPPFVNQTTDIAGKPIRQILTLNPAGIRPMA